MTTSIEAAALVNVAVENGHILKATAPNGDKLTVSTHNILRFGNSQFAEKYGKDIPIFNNDTGMTLVHQIGRALAAESARKALGLAAGKVC